MSTLFTLKNVTYKNILRYSDITISGSRVTFICGKSGTGKSTLLKLLNGVISPTSGEIRYCGEPLESRAPLVHRREVLLVSQSAYLFDKLTIAENFAEYYNYLDLPAPNDTTVREYLELCCADSLPPDSDCTVLSGGERQRVFLAINLSLNAKVLMLDEPTSALDSRTADTVMTNIKAHCRDKSMIVVSHDAGIVEKFADEVVSLGDSAPKLPRAF
jgi:putative ABC transport system ATP-binding protein